MKEDIAVTRFRDYIKIKSVHPNPDYESAVKFLESYAKEIGLQVTVYPKCDEYLDIVVMTLEGMDPSLPSLLLNSHTDVVPVFEEHWHCDAFSAYKDEKGNIYGRGTQDMKSVGIQYMEAMRRIIKEGKMFLRTIHVMFVPDEEIGGYLGMLGFMKTEFFKQMNVGFVLDEGLANPDDVYSVFYGERGPLWLEVICEGNAGHGSRFIENTAAEKLRKVMNAILGYREEQKKLFEDQEKCLTLGDVTTVNMTQISGGVAHNVVPTEFRATFDFRLTPTVDREEFESKLTKWCNDAGPDVTFKYLQEPPKNVLTSTETSDPWWNAFKSTMDQLQANLKTEIFPAATDSRFLREAGYPAIGFSPMKNTPILLHDHNEFLNEKVFLEGVKCYTHLIPNLANVPKH